ncbi:MAG: hypothetical protein IKS15_04675 [Opitutales bacterium]|nr:hypothetical protein [Opitutales bacterium]
MRIFLTIFCIFAHAAAFAQYQATVDSTGALQFPTAGDFKSENDIPSFNGVQILIDTTPTVTGFTSSSRSFTIKAPYSKNGTTYTIVKGDSTGSQPYKTLYTVNDRSASLTNWTDAEFKVLDANGNLVYCVSTQWGAQMGDDYTTNPAADLNAKIFYTCPQYDEIAGNGRRWIEYIHNDTNARTIYEHAQEFLHDKGIYEANPTIAGIIIQPNFNGTTVGGTSIKSIFGTNAYNTPAGNQYVYLKCSPTSVESTENPKYNIWRPIIPVRILTPTNLLQGN